MKNDARKAVMNTTSPSQRKSNDFFEISQIYNSMGDILFPLVLLNAHYR